jgi:rubredoxin
VPVEKPGHQGVWCSNCGYEFSSEPPGEPCPNCGRTSRTFGKVLNATATGKASSSRTVGKTLQATAKDTASMSWVHMGERVREYWERHPAWFVVNVVLVLGSPFLELLGLVGVWGVLVGEALGLLGFWVGPKASTKVREKTLGEIARGGDQ